MFDHLLSWETIKLAINFLIVLSFDYESGNSSNLFNSALNSLNSGDWIFEGNAGLVKE